MPREPRAEFDILTVSGGVVVIVDRDAGGPTVTNDAEAVVAAIVAEFGPLRIACLDTAGAWAELCHDGGRFTGYAPVAVVETTPEEIGAILAGGGDGRTIH